MKIKLPLYLGWRFTVSRREQRFISFVSLISLLGLVLGVAAMIIVLSVMNGFNHELRSRILRVIPHGFVETQAGFANWQEVAASLQQVPGIEAVSPVITGQALLVYEGKTFPVELQGIEPRLETSVSGIGNSMLLGELSRLSAEPFGIVLGQTLARQLGVSTGDKVNLLLPQLMVTPAGVFPRLKRFTVVGIFHVGADPDNQLALVSLNSAAILFRQFDGQHQPRLTQLRVRTQDVTRAESYLNQIQQAHPEWQVHSWADTHRTLFDAIKMEKRVIALLLFSVIGVAVFNITSILIMMVAEKRKDIAIFRVMGAEPVLMAKSFMLQGLIVGLAGILTGAVIGSLVAIGLPRVVNWLEATTGKSLFSPDVYYIAHIPTDWQGLDVLLIVAAAFVLTMFATIYPALKATTIDPVHDLND